MEGGVEVVVLGEEEALDGEGDGGLEKDDGDKEPGGEGARDIGEQPAFGFGWCCWGCGWS